MKKISNILIVVGILCFLAYGFYLAGNEAFGFTLLAGLILVAAGLIIKIISISKVLKGKA